MEEERIISNVEQEFENGPSTFKAASNFRRSDTVKMSKIIPNIGSFTLLVNMGSRQQEFDKDYIKYRTYLALHVDHQKAWFSIKRDGMEVNLKI